jgi:hypothetical protein
LAKSKTISKQEGIKAEPDELDNTEITAKEVEGVENLDEKKLKVDGLRRSSRRQA